MEKIALRRYYKNLRSQISEGYAQEASKLVTKNFINYISAKPLQTIAGYYPINSELSPIDLLETLHKTGHNIALPVLLEDSSLEFRVWNTKDQLEMRNNFMQPAMNAQKIIPDLIITPLLAADIYGNRLGYGKGCYDRTISIYRQLNPAISIVGLCYAVQVQNTLLPTQPQDQKLDLLITENSTILRV